MNDPTRHKALLETAFALTSALELGDVLRGMTRPLIEGTGHSRATITLYDPETDTLRVAESTGEYPVPSGDTLRMEDVSDDLREVIREKHHVLADYDASMSADQDSAAAHYRSHLALIVPVMYHDEVLGVLALDDPGTRREFPPLDIELAEEIALLAGPAIEVRRLVDALQRAHDRLAKTGALLEAHIENSPLAVVEFDPEFRILRWSSEAQKLFGWSADEVVGRIATELRWVHEEDADCVAEEFARLHSRERVRSLNVNRNYTKNGDIVLCEWYSSAIHDPQGGLLSVLSEVVDITTREADRARISRHSGVMEAIGRILAAALHADSESGLGRECLDVALDITGSPIGFIGEVDEQGFVHVVAMSESGWAESMPEGPGTGSMPMPFGALGLHGEVLLSGESVVSNAPDVNAVEGHPQIECFAGVPLTAAGRTIGIIAVANRPGGYSDSDREALEAISTPIVEAFERMRAEQQLVTSQKDLAQAQEIAQMGSWRLDAPVDRIVCSQEALRVFGLDRGVDLTVEVFLGRVHPDDRAEIQAAWERSLAGAPFDVEHRIVVGGTVKWVREQALFDVDDKGVLRGGIGTVRDITTQRTADAIKEELYQQVERERQRLRSVIDEVPVGFAIMDSKGAVLEINDANHRIWAGELPKAQKVDEFAVYRGYHRGTGEPLRPDEWPGPRALRSKLTVEEIIDIQRFDGQRRAARIRAVPITDDSGEISLVTVMTEDVQDMVEREELTAALGEIAAEAGAQFSVAGVLTEVLDRAAEALGADRAVAALGRGGSWEMARSYPAQSSGQPECGQPLAPAIFEKLDAPVAIDDATSDPRCDAKVVAGLGIQSLLHVPLHTQGSVIGFLLFCYRSEPHQFSETEVDFATRLMDITTISLDGAAAYQRERTIAQTLQEAIMSPPEHVEGLDSAALYEPAAGIANVGGDLYDMFALSERRAAIVVGDVSGKGIAAARLTSLVRDGIRAYAYEETDPALVMKRLNTILHRMSPVSVFATVFLGILDVETGVLRFCTAGHPPALIVRADGVELLDECRDSVVGAFDDVSFHACQATLLPGDRLVLYTDGLSEARSEGRLFGEQGICDALEQNRDAALVDLPRRLFDAARAYSNDTIRDDTVVLCVQLTP